MAQGTAESAVPTLFAFRARPASVPSPWPGVGMRLGGIFVWHRGAVCGIMTVAALAVFAAKFILPSEPKR